MPKVTVNSRAAIVNFERIWTETVNANHLLSEMWQKIILYGHKEPMTPQFMNGLLIEFLDPARESCRKSGSIAVECRKMIVDKAKVARKKKAKGDPK